jgi:hypothetical protein
MSIPSNNSARRWAAELRARGGFRWHQLRSWQTHRRAWGGSWWNRFRSGPTYGRDRRTGDGYWWHRFRSWQLQGRADTLAFAACVIIASVVLVGFLTMGRGSVPRLLGEALTVGVTDEGVPYVALDPEGLGEAQGGAAKDGASPGSGPSAVALFSVDTSEGVLSLVGGEGSSVGNDPQPPPGPNPGPGPSPVPSPGPSPSPTPPPTRTEPPPTTTDPPPTTTDPPLPTTDPPLPTTDPPLPTTDPPLPTTDPPLPTTEPPLPNTEGARTVE